MITTNISIRTIQTTQTTGLQEECTAVALEAEVVVEDTTEEVDMLLSILGLAEEVTTTSEEGEEEEDITTDMEREEGNTTTMKTRDNFHLDQVV